MNLKFLPLIDNVVLVLKWRLHALLAASQDWNTDIAFPCSLAGVSSDWPQFGLS